jgi:hypothetical protein
MNQSEVDFIISSRAGRPLKRLRLSAASMRGGRMLGQIRTGLYRRYER